MNQKTNQKVEINQEITGLFISVTSQESADIHEFLKDNEYEQSPKGLKEFILDLVYGEDEPEKEEPFFSKALKDPELLRQGAQAISSLVQAYRQKKHPTK